jgi:hypothetical protein
MRPLFIILACFAGVFTFAFLLAGILGLQDTQPPKDGRGFTLRLFDAIVLGGLGSVVLGFQKNWHTQREARAMIYAGLVALAALLLFGCLAVRSA